MQCVFNSFCGRFCRCVIFVGEPLRTLRGGAMRQPATQHCIHKPKMSGANSTCHFRIPKDHAKRSSCSGYGVETREVCILRPLSCCTVLAIPCTALTLKNAVSPCRLCSLQAQAARTSGSVELASGFLKAVNEWYFDIKWLLSQVVLKPALAARWEIVIMLHAQKP